MTVLKISELKMKNFGRDWWDQSCSWCHNQRCFFIAFRFELYNFFLSCTYMPSCCFDWVVWLNLVNICYRRVVFKPLHEVPWALHILYVSLYLIHPLQVLQSPLMSWIRCDRWWRHIVCRAGGTPGQVWEPLL